MVKGWVQHLNPEIFEIYIFHFGTKHDSETELAKAAATVFVDDKVTLSQWAEAILEAEIEVLIYPDIGMNTMTTKLASLRLAPIQVASWGHPETTGLPTIDYFISAEDLESDNSQENYTERLVKLPHLGCCYPDFEFSPISLDLARLGIDANLPVLICPGAPFKYAPQYDWVFVEIAKRLGQCQMVFFSEARSTRSDRFEKRLSHVFKRAGLGFHESCLFLPWLNPSEFFGLMKRADVFLDTIGFSGFNTAMQGVECGLPIVTREGHFMRGRLASGILKRMDLSELVAQSEDEYISLAVKLVRDREYQQYIRERIATSSNKLFGDLEPIRALEQFLISVSRPPPT